jgi:hypothetical protein
MGTVDSKLKSKKDTTAYLQSPLAFGHWFVIRHGESSIGPDKSDDLRNTSLLRSESKHGESMNPYLVA